MLQHPQHHRVLLEESLSVEVEVQGLTLVCKKTPAGSWVCCSEEEEASCARGFTPGSAAANWERSRHLGE